MSAARVYLFADRGAGLVVAWLCGPDSWSDKERSYVLEQSALYAKNHVTGEPARAWWLVECESAEAGRQAIANADFDGHSPGCTCEGIDSRGGCEREACDCSVHHGHPGGRILASGGVA